MSEVSTHSAAFVMLERMPFFGSYGSDRLHSCIHRLGVLRMFVT